MSTSRSYNPAPHRALTVPLAKERLPKHRDNAVMLACAGVENGDGCGCGDGDGTESSELQRDGKERLWRQL